jgi:ABC-type amino acid transport system permease subunit
MTEDTQARDKTAVIIGTVFSIPIFLVCYGLVATLIYVVHTFLMGVQGGEVNRLTELTAAVISSIGGVAAGRWLCDKALKSWSGWPIFVILILVFAMNVVASLSGYNDSVWDAVLQAIQLAAAIVASWFLAVRKIDFN